MLRKMELLLDEDDWNAIQNEIAQRQAGSRIVDPTGPTILAEGDSNLAGALVAESVRELNDLRYFVNGMPLE